MPKDGSSVRIASTRIYPSEEHIVKESQPTEILPALDCLTGPCSGFALLFALERQAQLFSIASQRPRWCLRRWHVWSRRPHTRDVGGNVAIGLPPRVRHGSGNPCPGCKERVALVQAYSLPGGHCRGQGADEGRCWEDGRRPMQLASCKARLIPALPSTMRPSAP